MLESKAAFARRKGWNRSTATRYARDGKLVVTESGMVDVAASEARLAAAADPLKEGVRARHRDGRRDRGREPGADDSGEATRADPNDSAYQLLTKHRAATEASKAELARLELEEKQGKLGEIEAMRKRAHQSSRRARDAILNLRYRVDPLLAGEADPVKRAEIWDRELRQVCEELARSIAEPLEAAPAVQ